MLSHTREREMDEEDPILEYCVDEPEYAKGEKAKKYRNFVFTHNNYENTDREDHLKCKYMIYGKEVGKKGTPHLQGFVVMNSPQTTGQMCKLMKCWVRPAKTIHKAIDYCKKDFDFTERGTPPKTQKECGEDGAEYWREIRQAAEEGRFDDIPEKIRFYSKKVIEDHRNSFLMKRKLEETDAQHLWYWGAAGTGKSRKARDDHPDAYLKMCNKWWDGYVDEYCVLIEDFDRLHGVLVHHMKIWADRYPFTAEHKGGASKIRPQLIIVTSNYHPRDIWTDPTDLEPILRRFKCVEFKALSSS